MMPGLMIRPAAELDVDQHASFIARHSDEQAIRFYQSVEARYSEIRERPQQWPLFSIIDHPRLASLRRCPVAGFPNHLIFYRATADVIEILRVLHGARDVRSVLLQIEE